MLALPRNPQHVLGLTDVEFDRVLAENPNVPYGPANCITCGGKGSFRWYDPGHEHVVDWECDCREQYKLHIYLLACGIPLSYQRLTWHDAIDAEPGALDAVMNYREKADARVRGGIGLLLHGEMGTGKSLLSYLLLKDMIKHGHDAMALTMHSFLERYTTGWANNDEGRAAKADFESRITHAGVLFLDDLAREYSGKSRFAESVLDHVLRSRVGAQRPTFITSNKDLVALATIYSTNALSLLSEVMVDYEFTGEDYRRAARQRRIRENDLGITRPVML
jgi:DNA replication protein DnaC